MSRRTITKDGNRAAGQPKRETSSHVERIARSLRPVLRKHAVCKAILFGSFARGEQTRHSDIDLILVKRTDRRFLDRYEGLLRDLNNAVEDSWVEPLIYTPEELAAMEGRPFIARALAEGVCIYEQE